VLRCRSTQTGSGEKGLLFFYKKLFVVKAEIIISRLERGVPDSDFSIIIAEPLIAFCMKSNQFRPGIFHLTGERVGIEIVSDVMTSLHGMIIEKQNILTGLGRGIPNLEQILSDNVQKLDDRVERLNFAFKNYLNINHRRKTWKN
jgi:hypothetical protein